MSFASLITLDGLGEVYALDVSLDGFSTISYYYSTAAGIGAHSEAYDARIISIGPIQRGLGQDFAMQAGSVEIVLANDDAGVDWLALYQSANALKARFRLYLGVYQLPFVSPATIGWKQLGEFSLGDFPRMDDKTVTITLDDDAQSLLEGIPAQPMFRNWTGSDGYFSNLGGLTADAELLPDFPIPLAWGTDWAQAHRASWFAHTVTGTLSDVKGSTPFVICATSDTGVTSYANDVQKVNVHLFGALGGFPTPVPSTINTVSFGTLTVWEAVRKSVLDRNSRTWLVIYVKFYDAGFGAWLTSKNLPTVPSPIGVPSVPGYDAMDMGVPGATSQIADVWVQGYPFSGRTINTASKQHPCDIITDLATYHYPNFAIPLDTTSLARVKAAFPSMNATGLTGGKYDRLRPLREVFSDLADSWDLDIFLGWDATIHVSSRIYDFDSQTATLPEITEARISEFSQRVPARQSRGAPYNRVEDRDTKQDEGTPAQGRTNVAIEPADDLVAQTAWRRILTRSRGMRWQPTHPSIINTTGIANVDIDSRPIDTTVRPMVEFRTDMEAMALELGDYFKLTWTRNKAAPYVAAVFRVEEMTLVPNSNSVLIKALYSDDLRSKRPYLLDNETYLTRVSSGGGRTATCANGSVIITFSSGSLISDGVAVGDHLILKDATEAATAFTRNRALAITQITDATHLQFDGADTGFGGGAAVATWEIRRAHNTYLYAGTDPTNYPSGGYPYGRVAASTLYSGNDPEAVVLTAAHLLREG